jgi:hypothetical protein
MTREAALIGTGTSTPSFFSYGSKLAKCVQFIQFQKDRPLSIASAWPSNNECLLPSSVSGFAGDRFGSTVAACSGQFPTPVGDS